MRIQPEGGGRSADRVETRPEVADDDVGRRGVAEHQVADRARRMQIEHVADIALRVGIHEQDPPAESR